MQIFKKAIFLLSPKDARHPFKAINVIKKKQIKELTNFEVGMIFNIIMDAPQYLLYKNEAEAEDKSEKLEELRMDFQIQYQENEKILNDRAILASGPNSNLSVIN
jgi:hypothetical protein